ncbi:AsnC family transcriptional regulator, partial [Microbacterium sp. ISL-103]|uniref:AsnC family transcriptional regulator n=1 Tax=Microbacterium sp. ISL-103 TaxID=2819156 RepID=UPI001BE50955
MITLDETDHAILGQLRLDARASMAAIAAAVPLSRAGAPARLKRLTDAGIITGYSVTTDPVLPGH